jgi:diguanylate cyclase (GGDEF)-like protein
MLSGSYSATLVVFSFVVAILASYTALNMAGRVARSTGRSARIWLAGGSFAMGFGIWSMHFVGMLAFSLPIALSYDLFYTALSLLIAIASSAFALWLVCLSRLPVLRLGLGAVLMGLGIASMHYTGMHAMLMNPGIRYDSGLMALSILIAILASGAALWIAFRLRSDEQHVLFKRIGASLLMGVAIVGMHFTGMAAAEFPVGSHCGAMDSGIETHWLAGLVIVISLAVFAIALVISMLDARTHVLAHSLSEANSELLKLALHDSLTGLPNRVLLGDRLEQAIQNGSRGNQRFAVLFMDLDGFKAINDVYGHTVGDLLLSEVARRINKAKRVQDTAARLGGDEFVLLVDLAEPEDAAALAQRLVEGIGRVYPIARHALHVSTSIGIAMFPNDGATAHALMINADSAMYYAKEHGRNGFRFFETAMNTNAHEQHRLQQDLRMALDRGEFILHYQPKLVAPRGPMTGVEALLRWQSPERGLVPPDQFLPMAERTGLIVPIGNWVIDEACRQMREWQDGGHADWTVAVNLSTVQLAHAGLVDTVRAALERNHLAPGHLVLEVTESTAMRDAEASLVILRQLSNLGVSISIDDFGTGYSSLLYLKRLPADELKIDRGFITELAQGNDDAAIVAAIVALGHTLGMRIVAEGVETIEQRDLLTRLGCHSLQGYLFGRPMPPQVLLDSLVRHKAMATHESVSG